jgi:1-aminocyclopropane-1-carboxylate synthase
MRVHVGVLVQWCPHNRVHCLYNHMQQRADSATDHVMVSQAEALPLLLHTVFGLSKDFCASGLRVGALYTRNATLMTVGLNVCAHFCLMLRGTCLS